MQRVKQSRLRRYVRHRNPGQSIPLIALMIVVLVAMVGLSVDVGNTFAEEREIVAATNAAALSGMTSYNARNASTTNQTIYDAINNSLRSNGIDVTDEDLDIALTYIDSEGKAITSVEANGSAVPENVAFIEVRARGTVDTFFARVVNRNTLPINASAYAGICPAGNGVYPLAVNLANINVDTAEFKDPGPTQNGEVIWGYSDTYPGRTWRRLYVGDVDLPGGFGWMRWMDGTGANGASANSAQELEASMAGAGNIMSGFQEVDPWPSSSLPQPADYPLQPGQINGGDWVHGSSGWKNSNDMRNIIQEHITNQTKMILPIFSHVVSNGSNGAYLIQRLGLFAITGRGGNGPNAYFDMVYLGDPRFDGTPCLATPPTLNTDLPVELWGRVAMEPQWPFIPRSTRPVQYVVVFDVSGSMNLNFNGQGIQNGKVAQCGNGPPGAPQALGCGDPASAWPNTQERRIYVAKKALELLVRQTNMPGNPGYDPQRALDTMALVWFNDNAPSGWTKGFRTDPNALITDITNANRQGNDPYKSAGGTNGAGGLYRASNILSAAPKTTTELGRTWNYKPVVIFVTDGVSNTFLNPNHTNLNGGQSNQNTYPSKPVKHTCNALGGKVVENALCQTTDFGGITTGIGNVAAGMDRPITQMVRVSKERIQANANVKGEVYVLALSNIPDTGLKDGVASTPSHFYAIPDLQKDAKGLTNVDKVILSINEKVELGQCEPRLEPATYVFPADQFISYGGLSYPDVGEATITDVANPNTSFTVPIAMVNGEMQYRFSNIPRGTYTLKAKVYFRDARDSTNTIPRAYSLISQNSSDPLSELTIIVGSSNQSNGFTFSQQEDIQLSLYGEICAPAEE